MGTKSVISAPFEVLSTDLIGPLPSSSNQNQYLSVTTDFFTKYVFLKPLRVATAKKIVQHIENDIILVHGAPKVIITDNGSQYISKEFKDMCDKYKVQLLHNVKYNPRHNPTERTNQTIEAMICKYLRENQKKWDALLPELQFALRSAVSAATGFSPHRLLFGRELELDGRHHLLGDVEDELPDLQGREERANTFHLHAEKLKDEVVARLKEAQEKSSARYNLRRRHEVAYSTGDKVWRQNFAKSDKTRGFSKKLAPRWLGPLKVARRIGRVSYLLEDKDGTIEGPWHVDQLKRHYA
jgi:transposase InsO family protein